MPSLTQRDAHHLQRGARAAARPLLLTATAAAALLLTASCSRQPTIGATAQAVTSDGIEEVAARVCPLVLQCNPDAAAVFADVEACEQAITYNYRAGFRGDVACQQAWVEYQRCLADQLAEHCSMDDAESACRALLTVNGRSCGAN